MLIKTLDKNEFGKDYIVGDLHGCYDFFELALNHVNFDTSKDRLFSVGDLIDRGPDSAKCLKLLDNKWFHAVLGNHEDMAIKAKLQNLPEWDNIWKYNGGDWYSGEDLTSLSELPTLITVKNSFHVLHAQLDNNIPVDDDDLADPITFAELAHKQSYDGDMVIWGRILFRSLFGKDLVNSPTLWNKFKRTIEYHDLDSWMPNKGLSDIYVGHTPLLQPVRVKSIVNIDTWACRFIENDKYGLTITDRTNFWTVNSNGIKKVKCYE